MLGEAGVARLEEGVEDGEHAKLRSGLQDAIQPGDPRRRWLLGGADLKEDRDDVVQARAAGEVEPLSLDGGQEGDPVLVTGRAFDWMGVERCDEAAVLCEVWVSRQRADDPDVHCCAGEAVREDEDASGGD